MAISWNQRLKEYDSGASDPATTSATIANTAGSLMIIGVFTGDVSTAPSVVSISSSALSNIEALGNGLEPVLGWSRWYFFKAIGTGTTAALTVDFTGGTAPYNAGYIVYEISETGKMLQIKQFECALFSEPNGDMLTVDLPNSVQSGSEVLFTVIGSGDINTDADYTQFYTNASNFYTEAWYEPSPSGTAEFSAQASGQSDGLYLIAEIGAALKPKLMSVLSA